MRQNRDRQYHVQWSQVVTCTLYWTFKSDQQAARALEVLNFTPLNGNPIRIMYSHRDSSMRTSGAGNIYIKNLDLGIDNKALYDTFLTFGNILSCKVVTDSSGQSKGYGFVQYDNEEAAQQAIEKMNGMILNGKHLYVGPFLCKEERERDVDRMTFTNVYVKNLSESTREKDLSKTFCEFGRITSVAIMRDVNGNSKCFGFVNFQNAEDAARAIEALNGQRFDNKKWYVGKAQKKSERECELKIRFEQSVREALDNSQGTNLYVKNLDDSIDDDKLKDLFSPFGTIISCKVMRGTNRLSKGSGFVAFSSPEETSKALLVMNGKMVVCKPLYVARAERKEDRRARLKAQFSQMRPIAMAPAVPPHMLIYRPGALGLGQEIFYRQARPIIIPPQQLVPGMRSVVAPMLNFLAPLVHPGQRPDSGRMGPVPAQQSQQPVPVMQQQLVPRRGAYRYPQGCSMPDVSMPGLAGGMLSAPYDMGSTSHPVWKGALASSLANATAAEQKTILGENLYRLVEQLVPSMAEKVTGMLLEMDLLDVLHLIESPETLKPKVAEAMVVLGNVTQQQEASNPADQLASLSLSDGIASE